MVSPRSGSARRQTRRGAGRRVTRRGRPRRGRGIRVSSREGGGSEGVEQQDALAGDRGEAGPVGGPADIGRGFVFDRCRDLAARDVDERQLVGRAAPAGRGHGERCAIGRKLPGVVAGARGRSTRRAAGFRRHASRRASSRRARAGVRREAIWAPGQARPRAARRRRPSARTTTIRGGAPLSPLRVGPTPALDGEVLAIGRPCGRAARAGEPHDGRPPLERADDKVTGVDVTGVARRGDVGDAPLVGRYRDVARGDIGRPAGRASRSDCPSGAKRAKLRSRLTKIVRPSRDHAACPAADVSRSRAPVVVSTTSTPTSGRGGRVNATDVPATASRATIPLSACHRTSLRLPR